TVCSSVSSWASFVVACMGGGRREGRGRGPGRRSGEGGAAAAAGGIGAGVAARGLRAPAVASVAGEGAAGVAEERAEPLQPVPELSVGAVGGCLRPLPERHHELADGGAVEGLADEEAVELLQAVGDGEELLALGGADLALPVVDAV